MASTIDVEELIARPLDVIARLRGELKARDATTNSGGEESALLAEAISDALCSGSSPALAKVPVLSRESLAEGKLAANSLVRYRGMVQDQYEPEYFVGSFEEVETATGQRSRVDVKYVDSIAQRPGCVNEYDGPGAKTMDRLPLYCVPVPGLSAWAIPPDQGRQEEREGKPGVIAAAATGGGLPKRQREDGTEGAGGEGEDAMDCTEESAADSGEKNGGPQQKALRAAANGVPGEPTAAAANGSSNGSKATPAFHHGQELELAGVACVVKLYDFREGQMKLNDTAEFVGVLGYDQASEATPRDQDGDVPMSGGEGAAGPQQQQQALSSSSGGGGNPFQGLEDFSRKVPPPSLAPRLHCVFHRKVAPGAPLAVDPDRPQDALHALSGPLSTPLDAFMRDAKRRAIEHLAGALGGDSLAAEYALLAILSRAYVRTESLAPGSLSLNLRGVVADQVSGFHAAVSDLVPKCVRVPITTKSLSEKFKFAPKKDYEADRLMVSSLQLSDGTVVVLDETSLEPGKVGTEGVGNLAALNSLAALQKVPYDFGFYKMDFEVDHPTISLSLRGSVVPTGAVVPVVAASADEAGGSTASPASSEEVEGEVGAAGMMLERLRVYVEATRRTELSLDEASSALAEEDFVKARQQGQAVTGEDFHRMLTIARLTALSFGDDTMTAAHWNHMKDLEARVDARVQQQKVRATSGGSSNGCSGVAPAATVASAAGGATPISPGGQAGPLNAIPENE